AEHPERAEAILELVRLHGEIIVVGGPGEERRAVDRDTRIRGARLVDAGAGDDEVDVRPSNGPGVSGTEYETLRQIVRGVDARVPTVVVTLGIRAAVDIAQLAQGQRVAGDIDGLDARLVGIVV